MRVKLEELQRASSLLLEHLKESGQDEFEIEEDFYWDISGNSRYDAYAVGVGAEDVTVGQLSDDWSEIQLMLRGERGPVGYGLVWLSAVLRRVGEKAVG